MWSRLGLSLLVLGLLLATCGREPSIAGRIDAIRRDGTFPTFRELPSKARRLELYPRSPGPAERARFAECPEGLAILELGASAVPELIRLLNDRRRRTYAAAFLGEIGGPRAAEALVATWRAVRATYTEMSVVRTEADGMRRVHQRYEPEDGGLLRGAPPRLVPLRRPARRRDRRDTSRALGEVDRLAAEGAAMDARERAPAMQGRRPPGTSNPSRPHARGLHILGMCGAPRPCRSSIGRCDLPSGPALGRPARRDLPRARARADPPALGGVLLDDPALRGGPSSRSRASGRRPPGPPSASEVEAEAVARYRKRLQELGHLPQESPPRPK
jgi:hypothetical protein